MRRIDFPAVYLLHGMGGSPNGSVAQLETELRGRAPEEIYVRPLMPHIDSTVAPSVSVSHLRALGVPQAALAIGISLGGTVAARLQEQERSDLHVICVSSPTHAGVTRLRQHMALRVALYCSADPVIAGRTQRWPQLAEAYDISWLKGHDIDPHKSALAHIISCYIHTGCLNGEIE